MTKHAYYMTERPFGPGCQPKLGLVDAESYDEKTFVDEIGREAWSKLVYDRELSEDEVNGYELTPAEQKLFLGYARFEDGKTLCHAKGTLSVVKESERLVRETSKIGVRGFIIREVSREFFEAYA